MTDGVLPMADFPRPIRIGQIDFTNVWPVVHYFPVESFGSSIEMVSQVPTELNRSMLEGSIDIGPISSYAYAQSYDRYVLLPDLSVSAYGAVNSILLFYRNSLDRVRNGRIALSTASATSVNLLKIILEKFHDGKPVYFWASPSLHDMMEGNDAALLIGDDAIRASWDNRDYRVLDLGAEWTRLTGCWMSYAVWAVRREVAEALPKLIARIYSELLISKSKGLANPDEIISAAIRQVGGNAEFWRNYFSGISHEFSADQMAGLQLYYSYAAELGLLPGQVPLTLWNDAKNLLQVNE